MRLCSIMSETAIFNLLLREGREKKVFRTRDFFFIQFQSESWSRLYDKFNRESYSAFVCGCLMRAAAVETMENMFFVISKHQIWAIKAAKV